MVFTCPFAPTTPMGLPLSVMFTPPALPNLKTILLAASTLRV